VTDERVLLAVTPDGPGVPMWLFVPVAVVIVGIIVYKRLR
jgi:hypothetical protein